MMIVNHLVVAVHHQILKIRTVLKKDRVKRVRINKARKKWVGYRSMMGLQKLRGNTKSSKKSERKEKIRFPRK